MLGTSSESGLPPASRSVLVVCAHPDDESFGLGGVLDSFAQAGAELSVLCFTHGEASSLGADERLGEIRSAELTAAAFELGAGRVWLLDHQDGALSSSDLSLLAGEVARASDEVAADMLVVFDEGGVTGHPDHSRATEAALVGGPSLPVLAWTLPHLVAEQLNTELGTSFLGRRDEEIDLWLEVDRDRQRRAIACHVSQSSENPVLWRRLELLGDKESLRWLRSPGPPQRGEVP